MPIAPSILFDAHDPGYGFTGLQRATGMAALRPDKLNLRSEEFSSWWRDLTDAIRKQV